MEYLPEIRVGDLYSVNSNGYFSEFKIINIRITNITSPEDYIVSLIFQKKDKSTTFEERVEKVVKNEDFKIIKHFDF